MATWQRFFTSHSAPSTSANGYSKATNTQGTSPSNSSFVSFLPEVYAGAPNRIERYQQFESMELDGMINAALNTIAEFCTQENNHTHLPFVIQFKTTDATDTEKETLEESLKQWCYINDFRTRIYHIFRKTLVYGDCFFVRDPETFEWIFVDPKNVEKVAVDELKGKVADSYFFRDLDLNVATKTLSTAKSPGKYFVPAGLPTPGNPNYPGQNTWSSPGSQSRFSKANNTTEIPAEHVIHLSLNTGLEPYWPFGNSILEPVFKSHKQKELLEDSMVIYRVQRAPERRVFYVDTGTLPSHKAMAFVERVKNEVQQRRIPSRTGGGSAIMDAAYNPLSILEDYWFPQNSDGKGSRVELLPGGADIGTINDLLYFNNQLVRGLGVPSSYLPTGPEDSNVAYSDGKTGAAYIQEWRFSKFCRRIQNLLIKYFDYEFKLFLKQKGIIIESSQFELDMEEPESFAEYRAIEKDTAHFNILSQALGVPFFSKRFALKRYGGLSEAEILENEKLWREENKNKLKSTASAAGIEEPGVSLRNVGIPPIPMSPAGGELNIPEEPTTRFDQIAGAGEAARTTPGIPAGAPVGGAAPVGALPGGRAEGI